MIKGSDFLTQSDNLVGIADAKPDQEEVYLRSAVSRAYYGLFNEAKSYLQSTFSDEYNEASKANTKTQKRDLDSEKSSEHRIVIDTLYNVGIKLNDNKIKAYSSQFKSFRNFRNDADYHLTNPEICFKFRLATIPNDIQRIRTLLIAIQSLKP